MTSTGICRIARMFSQASVFCALAHFSIFAPLAEAGLKGELQRAWRETWQESSGVQADQSQPGTNKDTFDQAAHDRAKAQERAPYMKARATDQRIENIRSVQSDLAKELNALVTEIKAYPTCRDGCKDFAVWCNAPDRIGKAERANGISDARFIGLEWLRFGGASVGGLVIPGNDKKWHLEKVLIRFEKINGVWSKKDEHGMMFDETIPICDRNR